MPSIAEKRSLEWGAVSAAAGALLSGPVSVMLTLLIQPQPPWQGVETFIANRHPIQNLGYLFGLVLLSGSVVFVSAARQMMLVEERVYGNIALAFTSIASGLVTLNYLMQAVYLPQAGLNEGAIISAFSMVNPVSFGWALEMSAYAILGIGFWFTVPAFRLWGRSIIPQLLTFNAAISILGAAITWFDLSWVLRAPGLVAFALWNSIFIWLLILVFVKSRQKDVT